MQCINKAAVEEGILPGGGTALLYATNVLKNLKVENDDQRYGVDIVRKALSVLSSKSRKMQVMMVLLLRAKS